MNKLMDLLDELDALEAQRNKTEMEFFDDETDPVKEAAFDEAVNAESDAFNRICKAIEEKSNGQILSHVAMRIVLNKRDALREILSCM